MWQTKKYNQINKYGARRIIYNNQVYHSKKEAEYAEYLNWRKRAKEIKDWQRQVKVSLDVNGRHICNYYVDFVIEYPSGEQEWVEVKGYATPAWKLKRKLFEALYPKRKYIVVK